MKIHMLQCGSIRVDPTVPFGKRLDVIEAARQLTAADKNRITLPVFAYLIEHPRGLILVDTGWCREISPEGVYEIKARIVGEGLTMQETLDRLHRQYGWSDSASNFSNKLQRNSLRYREVVELADVIGYELKWVPRERGDADDEC